MCRYPPAAVSDICHKLCQLFTVILPMLDSGLVDLEIWWTMDPVRRVTRVRVLLTWFCPVGRGLLHSRSLCLSGWGISRDTPSGICWRPACRPFSTIYGRLFFAFICCCHPVNSGTSGRLPWLIRICRSRQGLVLDSSSLTLWLAQVIALSRLLPIICCNRKPAEGRRNNLQDC